MTTLGILCAMDKEYELMFSHMHNKRMLSKSIFCATTHKDGGKSVMVKRCGVGKVNAALSAKKMIDMGALNIISIGCAGGASESVNVGDIVVGNSYCYHDVWCGEPNKPGQIQGLPSVFPSSFGLWMEKISNNEKIKLGTIATGDWFVQSREKMEQLVGYLPSSHNVLAVDMESAAIAHVCYEENIPFMSIRVISDNPLFPEQQKQYDGFWNDMAEESFKTLFDLIS